LKGAITVPQKYLDPRPVCYREVQDANPSEICDRERLWVCTDVIAGPELKGTVPIAQQDGDCTPDAGLVVTWSCYPKRID
jgi:hypothetical protein